MTKALILLTAISGLALSAYFISQTDTQAPEVDSQQDLRYASTHLSQMRFQAPMDLDFAGEAVPMEMERVRKKLQKELNQKILHTAGTHQLYRRVFRYQHLITSILEDQGIPTDFFYLSMAESALSNAVSHVGAAGFWQFMPATGRQYGLTINETIDERFDPIKSTYAAIRYFKALYKELDSWTLAAAAYNMGPSGLLRAMKRQKEFSYYSLDLNRETSQYLYRILSNKCIVEQPGRYGYDLSLVTPYSPIRYQYVKVREDIQDLSTFAAEYGLSLDQLMTVNPWLKQSFLTAEQTLSLRIPLSKDFFAAELKVKDWSHPEITTPEDTFSIEPVPVPSDTIHREAVT